jgi:hypothetical protein
MLALMKDAEGAQQPETSDLGVRLGVNPERVSARVK